MLSRIPFPFPEFRSLLYFFSHSANDSTVYFVLKLCTSFAPKELEIAYLLNNLNRMRTSEWEDFKATSTQVFLKNVSVSYADDITFELRLKGFPIDEFVLIFWDKRSLRHLPHRLKVFETKKFWSLKAQQFKKLFIAFLSCLPRFSLNVSRYLKALQCQQKFVKPRL